MHEASLLVAYKLWTMNLMADMDSGVQMMIKGKVPVVPKVIKNRQQVRKIFEKSSSLESGQPAPAGSGEGAR
jgi:hypothetical protein